MSTIERTETLKIYKIEEKLFELKKSVKDLFLNVINKIEALETEINNLEKEMKVYEEQSSPLDSGNTIKDNEIVDLLLTSGSRNKSEQTDSSPTRLNLNTVSTEEFSVEDSVIYDLSIKSTQSPRSSIVPGEYAYTGHLTGKIYNIKKMYERFKRIFQESSFTPSAAIKTSYSSKTRPPKEEWIDMLNYMVDRNMLIKADSDKLKYKIHNVM